VQRKIEAVISGRRRAVVQDGVIEQIGKRGERTIEGTNAAAVPVALIQNQVNVPGGRLADASVLPYGGEIV